MSKLELKPNFLFHISAEKLKKINFSIFAKIVWENIRKGRFLEIKMFVRYSQNKSEVWVLFGTDPDRNRVTWETPNSEAIPSVESH
jgi:hypothetical protein